MIRREDRLFFMEIDAQCFAKLMVSLPYTLCPSVLNPRHYPIIWSILM